MFRGWAAIRSAAQPIYISLVLVSCSFSPTQIYRKTSRPLTDTYNILSFFCTIWVFQDGEHLDCGHMGYGAMYVVISEEYTASICRSVPPPWILKTTGTPEISVTTYQTRWIIQRTTVGKSLLFYRHAKLIRMLETHVSPFLCKTSIPIPVKIILPIVYKHRLGLMS